MLAYCALVLLVAMGCGPTLEECKERCAGADRFEWTASSHQANTCNCFSLGTPNAKPSAEAAP